MRTLQAEDEIAAAGVAIGAAFAGHLGVTATSGPGVDLKSEAMGLAISLELPLVVIDVQRGGPSTGLPTKTEQADLLLAMYGRHGEAPLPIVAASSPSHCFDAAFEAVRIALKYRTPVILLTDGYLANGAEPWLLPDVDALPDISVPFADAPNHEGEFWPYLRDPRDARPPVGDPGHARPHAPHRRHREAGRHRQRQLRPREPRAHGAAARREDRRASPTTSRPSSVDDPDGADAARARVGEHVGRVQAAARRVRAQGHAVAHAHLVHLNPFPPTSARSCARYPKVLVPEMNLGQLSRLVRAEYLVDAQEPHQGAGRAVPRRPRSRPIDAMEADADGGERRP